jgi:hypothetical protein
MKNLLKSKIIEWYNFNVRYPMQAKLIVNNITSHGHYNKKRKKEVINLLLDSCKLNHRVNSYYQNRWRFVYGLLINKTKQEKTIEKIKSIIDSHIDDEFRNNLNYEIIKYKKDQMTFWGRLKTLFRNHDVKMNHKK